MFVSIFECLSLLNNDILLHIEERKINFVKMMLLDALLSDNENIALGACRALTVLGSIRLISEVEQ
jgi:hypothetical protein